MVHLGGPVTKEKDKKKKKNQEGTSPALGLFLGMLLCWRVVINMQLTHTLFHSLGRGYNTIISSQVCILL